MKGGHLVSAFKQVLTPGALGRCVAVSVAVALVAPVVMMLVAATGYDTNPLTAGPFEAWWERFLVPFRMPGAWQFWLGGVGWFLLFGLAASLGSVAWIGRALGGGKGT